MDICTRIAHGMIDEVKVYLVFCKTTSLFETLCNVATMMSEKFSESTGNRTSQKLRMVASNLSSFDSLSYSWMENFRKRWRLITCHGTDSDATPLCWQLEHTLTRE